MSAILMEAVMKPILKNDPQVYKIYCLMANIYPLLTQDAQSYSVHSSGQLGENKLSRPSQSGFWPRYGMQMALVAPIDDLWHLMVECTFAHSPRLVVAFNTITIVSLWCFLLRVGVVVTVTCSIGSTPNWLATFRRWCCGTAS